jgi:hypothetical protein
MENAEKKIRNFQRTISLSNIKGIKVLTSTTGNRFKNTENIGKRTIFIPSDIVSSDRIKEVDQILNSFDYSCAHIEDLIVRINMSVKYDIYRGIEIASSKIIKHTDELFYIYRKLRKRFIQIGFARLRAMNKAQKIPDTMTKIKNILEHFLYLRNICYFSEKSIFNENIEKGCEILDVYIEKFNYLIEGCQRWLEKFFD